MYKDINRYLEYDIYLLDINMVPVGGLEIAKRIRQYNKEAYIAFITGFIDYAMEGYKVDAIRYILKDSLKEMLSECMEVILQRIQQKNKSMMFHFIEGDRKIFLDNIIYIESNKHKVIFHMHSDRNNLYTVYDKLDHVSEMLEHSGFLRIHKSYLVNMKYIQKIQKYEVAVENNIVLPVPREKYKCVEEKYYEYEGEML